MENDTELKDMYMVTVHLINASKLIFPYNKLASDILLEMSSSITKDIEVYKSDTGDLSNKVDKAQVDKMLEQVGFDIDLFVDDGSHISGAQIRLCEMVMPLLNKDVVYIIEDTAENNVERVLAYLTKYDCFVPKLPNPRGWGDTTLIMVKHK